MYISAIYLLQIKVSIRQQTTHYFNYSEIVVLKQTINDPPCSNQHLGIPTYFSNRLQLYPTSWENVKCQEGTSFPRKQFNIENNILIKGRRGCSRLIPWAIILLKWLPKYVCCRWWRRL